MAPKAVTARARLPEATGGPDAAKITRIVIGPPQVCNHRDAGDATDDDIADAVVLDRDCEDL